MKSHSVNKKPYFICGWYINKKVCTNLIKYFENSSNQRAGTIGVKGKPGIKIDLLSQRLDELIEKKNYLQTFVLILEIMMRKF